MMGRRSVDEFLEELRKEPDYEIYDTLFELSETISEQIAQQRNYLGLTQEQLALKMGTKQSQVSRLEDPTDTAYTLETLVRAAKALEAKLTISFESGVANFVQETLRTDLHTPLTQSQSTVQFKAIGRQVKIHKTESQAA